ncbi:hypothetical protein PR048_002654 [Dryococelus australis]|uniref:Uncharacterized protein n=1 Tax=Dryococelus australis TaxID=614101 RepID=A0ABQ9IN71_9NEOP|nr:hypothetical protein PR048_002654 [Dryococelus australis]
MGYWRHHLLASSIRTLANLDVFLQHIALPKLHDTNVVMLHCAKSTLGTGGSLMSPSMAAFAEELSTIPTLFALGEEHPTWHRALAVTLSLMVDCTDQHVCRPHLPRWWTVAVMPTKMADGGCNAFQDGGFFRSIWPPAKPTKMADYPCLLLLKSHCPNLGYTKLDPTFAVNIRHNPRTEEAANADAVPQSGRAAVAEWSDCSPRTRVNRVNPRPGTSRIFARGTRAGRCRWSASFHGDLPFLSPLHSCAAPYSPN